MEFNIRGGTMLAGIACATGGTFAIFGVGWALVTAGALLIGLALVG